MSDNIKQLIVDLRGGVPNKCDFCEEATPEDQLHPEEAGAWICIACIKEDEQAYFGGKTK